MGIRVQSFKGGFGVTCASGRFCAAWGKIGK